MKQIFVYGNREKYKNYAEALTFCGAMGIFTENLDFARYCDGLLLTGGADVDPALYGAANLGSMGIDRKRDEAEISLIRTFSESGRPILGICRGLQIINVALGGDLVQDIPTAPAHRWEESSGDKAHGVTAEKDSFLYPLYGERFAVNSAHHQAVKTPGEGLSVAAMAEDGVIEALENRERNIYATQWHPERMAFRKARPDTVDGRYIFEFFLSKC
ncbi:MAG: gamma-glutamyl-gamma-aminobutyrate hydrolase family protein [Acutalibacter sp.]|nr:gamma-glutamyl-gamma-aminobutyrate hydrolase family protein [Acutalibacter sp.]